jgi:hypothetical protein
MSMSATGVDNHRNPGAGSATLTAGAGAIEFNGVATPTRGIHANGTGTVTLRLKEDAAARDFSVIEGAFYPYEVAYYTAGSVTLVGIF